MPGGPLWVNLEPVEPAVSPATSAICRSRYADVAQLCNRRPSIHTVGGVVTPAQALLVVVPADARLEAEAMVSNRDIGFVVPGQTAEIKIDTFNFTKYGLLHGQVMTVSQDVITRDKPADKADETKSRTALSDSSEPQGQELVYSARVSLDRTEMQIEDKIVSLAPGMAVTVEIKTGQRRVIEYLLSPLLRYRHEAIRER